MPEEKLSPWQADLQYVRDTARLLMDQIGAATRNNKPSDEEARNQWAQHFALFFGSKEPAATHFVELSDALLRYHEHEHAREADAPAAATGETLTPQDVAIMEEYLTRPVK